MIRLFLWISAANLMLMSVVFGMGFGAIGPHDEPAGLYMTHLILGITAGLWCAFTHTAVFTYFVATSKWLQAATDKAALDPRTYVSPSLTRKGKAFLLGFAAVTATMAAMMAGAGTDPTAGRLWDPQVHLALAASAIVVNFLCALAEYRLILAQGRLIDDAAALTSAVLGEKVEDD